MKMSDIITADGVRLVDHDGPVWVKGGEEILMWQMCRNSSGDVTVHALKEKFDAKGFAMLWRRREPSEIFTTREGAMQ